VTILADHQFELLVSEDDSDGVVFGIGRPVSCTADGFDAGVPEWIVQDRDNSYNGSTLMGRDVRKGSPFTWQLFVNTQEEPDALAELAAIGRAWSPDTLGEPIEPGSFAVLRYQLAGRTRRVYGRPRRFGQTINNSLLFGMIPITADFQRVNALFFDDVLETDTFDLVVESGGGVVYPVVYPITSLPSGSQEGQILVGGTVKTYPIIRFTGPVVDPELITPAWTLRLNTTILEDDWIEIDTRPWVMTVKNQSGASVAGTLDPRLRMRDMVLTPGNQSFTLRGDSSTNTASVTIKRYPAHATL
jgi:hypothetical protein